MRFRVLGRAVVMVLLVAVIAAVVAGCEDPYAPLTPTPATKTESFTGSFAQNGSVVHSFPVAAYGPITIKLTSVGPLASMGLGVSLSIWDGANCGTGLITNVNAKAGAEALTGSVQAGNYCIRVFDSGNLPPDWTVTYAAEVLHP